MNLQGKNIVFLGSSVTYGYASGGVSFADILAQKYDFKCIKEAVSGTTLVDSDETSYVSRLKTIEEEHVDLFVCQLSTNDAWKDVPLGEVNGSKDTSTIAGAMEYIIDYARKKWNCPVIFYTSPKFDHTKYQEMVNLLYEIAKQNNIPLIDLWADEDFNAIQEVEREQYMKDPIHPTYDGYLKWWIPYFENFLLNL